MIKFRLNMDTGGALETPDLQQARDFRDNGNPGTIEMIEEKYVVSNDPNATVYDVLEHAIERVNQFVVNSYVTVVEPQPEGLND